MKAVRRFDPERGVRLVSFALHWIRAEMHEYILRNWRLVKIATTKAQRKLFFNLRSMRPRAGTLTPDRGERHRDGAVGQARRSHRDGNAALGPGRRAGPPSRRRGRVDDADRVPHRHRGRAGADSRARTRPRATAARACARRCRGSMTAAAPSSKRAGCARTTRRRCRISRISTAYPPSASGRSKARR